METLDAFVEADGDRYFIKIIDGDAEINIPISDDNANEVKRAFNKLLIRVQTGIFQVKLDKGGDDLFSLVASEYLVQLNREIKEVHGEMKRYGWVVDGV